MKKKIIRSILIIIFVHIEIFIFGQQFEWAKALGGNGRDIGNSVSVDKNGNVISTGFFQNLADFDGGTGIYQIQSKGNYDIYISKLDKDGNFIWAKGIGGIYEDSGQSITTDDKGNLYVCGYYSGVVDFDPGEGTYNLISSGNYNIFILKLDSDGNFLFAKSIGYGIANAIELQNGYLYIAGNFSQTTDFDPGAGTSNLIGSGAYILKLDLNGNFIWAKAFNGNDLVSGKSISVDDNENIITTGVFYNTVDLDPSLNVSSFTSSGNNDIYIVKLDSNGDFIWARSFGAGDEDIATSITTDHFENIFITSILSSIIILLFSK